MPRRSRIEMLPDKLRAELDARLLERRFLGFERLCRWLKQKGHRVSTSTLYYYAQKMKRQLDAARIAALQNFDCERQLSAARKASTRLREGGGDATIHLFEQLLFEKLIHVDPDEIKPSMIAKYATAIVAVVRADVVRRKRRDGLLRARREEQGREEKQSQARGSHTTDSPS